MADEHESAFAAWLDSPETKREMDIIRRRLDYDISEYEAIQLALQMEILVAMNVYRDEESDITIEINKPPEDEIDPADRWKYTDPDATGSP